MNLGPTELIVILVIALLVFGPGKLPELGKALGKSIREFRETMSAANQAIQTAMDDDATQPAEKPTQKS